MLTLWAATVLVSVLLLLFLGAAYSSLVGGSALLVAVFFASSRSRWIALQRWVWVGDDATESTWSLTVAVLLIVLALLWLVITVVLFIGGNPAVLA